MRGAMHNLILASCLAWDVEFAKVIGKFETPKDLEVVSMLEN